MRMAVAGLEIVDPAPVAAEVAGVSPLRGCNGCELELGRKLGADFVAVGWVQKVSNLILNLNCRSATSTGGDSWRPAASTSAATPTTPGGAGALYLLEHRILPPA